MYYVYALIDPINNLPFYIGKGSNKRAWQHLKVSNSEISKKANLIRTIRKLGFEPEVKFILENIESERYAYDLEYQCIQLAKYFGITLTNRIGVDLRPPSRKGCSMSIEARKKISDAQIGRVYPSLSTEQRDKISKATRGKKKPPRSAEYRQNIGNSKAKLYEVIFPTGESSLVFNLTKFCRENDLSQSKMNIVAHGGRSHHKNFKCRLIE